jgi:CheY-like chemotaxis protein
MNQAESAQRSIFEYWQKLLSKLIKNGWLKMMAPCILVIDHDVKQLVNLEASLNRAGYRVLTAHDDRQAVYLAQAARPEVIICDVAKRSRNAADVKRTLAQDAQTAAIPFVPLTRNRQELVARVNAVIRSQTFL